MKSRKLFEYRGNDGYIDLDKFLLENNIQIEIGINGHNDKKVYDFEDASIIEKKPVYESEKTDIIEMLVEELAKQVGIRCAKYDIAKKEGTRSILSWNFLEKEKEQFISMEYIFRQLGMNKKIQDDTCDEINNIFDAINKYIQLKGKDKKVSDKINREIAKVVIFDAHVMNIDRSNDNYGTVHNIEADEYCFAPILDNELCFGSGTVKNLVEEYKEISLEEQINFINTQVSLHQNCIYVEGYRSGKKMQHGYYTNRDFELLDYLSKSSYGKKTISEISKKLNIEEAISSVEEKMGCKIQDEYKDLWIKLFNSRKELLNDFIEINKDKKAKQNVEIAREK